MSTQPRPIQQSTGQPTSGPAVPPQPGESDDGVEVQLEIHVDPDMVHQLPAELAREFNILPVALIADRLVLASDHQFTPQQLEVLSEKLGRKIHLIVSRLPNLESSIQSFYSGPPRKRQIGEILTEQKAVTPEEVAGALEKQKNEPKRLGEILLELGLISKEELNQGLEKQSRESGPLLNPYLLIDPQNLRLTPEATARRYQVLPLEQSDGELLVASGRFLDASELSELKTITGLTVKPFLADRRELETAIDQCYESRESPNAPKLRIGDLLCEKGLITQEQLQFCLKQQKETKLRLGDLVVQLGYANEESVYRCLAEKLGHEYHSFEVGDLDLQLVRMIPHRFAETHRVLPLKIEGGEGGHLVIAMAEPGDLKVQDTLKSIALQAGYKLKAVLASPDNLARGVAYTYNSDGGEDHFEMEAVTDEEDGRRDLAAGGDLSQIRKIVNQVLYSAVVEGASDLHIEHMESGVRVRFRVDGILHHRKTPITKHNVPSVLSVIKLDSGLDITERRRSQDGVLKMRVDKERFIDFRINVHATTFGEDAVIRILDRNRNLVPLDNLGLPPAIAKSCLRLVENPQGLLLVTGPTGSGKTTTLYSMLNHLNSEDRKIVTAEDPVEYYMDGLCQYQVNESIGNTFADYGRRFLRKDPDIILIGEIRDDETAMACLKAAMTGHLVFSTLHTNDSLGSFLRLINLGVDRSFMSDALMAVMSQRLVRRICHACETIDHPPAEVIEEFYPNGPPEGVRFKKGQGCAACGSVGFRGRLGIYELWEITPDIRKLISSEASEKEIRQASLEGGLSPLLADGLNKVESGLTTLGELQRALPLDQIRQYANMLATARGAASSATIGASSGDGTEASLPCQWLALR